MERTRLREVLMKANQEESDARVAISNAVEAFSRATLALAEARRVHAECVDREQAAEHDGVVRIACTNGNVTK